MSQSPELKNENQEAAEAAKMTKKKAAAPRRTKAAAAKKEAAEETANNAEAGQAEEKPGEAVKPGTGTVASKARAGARRSASKKAEAPAAAKETAVVPEEETSVSEAPVPAKKTRSRTAGARKTAASKKKEVASPDAAESVPAADASVKDESPSKTEKIEESREAAEPQNAGTSAEESVMPSSLSSGMSAASENDAVSEAVPAARRRRKTVRSKNLRAALEQPESDGEEGQPSEAEPAIQPVISVQDDNAGNRTGDDGALQETQPVWNDVEKVTNILPFQDPADDVRNLKRIKRGRRLPGGQPDFNSAYYQGGYEQQISAPERLRAGKRKLRERRPRRQFQNAGMQPFDADYNAALYDDSILGAAQSKLQESRYYPEDDGPQPVLPDQPQAADFTFPAAEEDYAALDDAVNGNQASPAPFKGGRQPKGSRKFQREGRPAKSDAASQQEKAEAKKVRRVLYLSVVPNEQAEVVITEDGQVAEYFVEMAHQVKIRGNIYKGTINNIDANLQAAFVNFGNGKNGFLQIDEVHPEYYLAPHDESQSGSKYPPIQKVLKVGQEVLVQIVKEPAGSKGAFLTTWISIAGRFLVLTPGKEQIGVSRKVTDPSERARLKELLNGIQPGENMGVIIRTASEGADKESIQQDLAFLKKMYEEIKEKASSEKSPVLIYQEADLVARSIRDYLSEDIAEIWTDDEETKNRVEETVRLLFPGKDIVRLHKDPRHGMWERFSILKQIESVTSREVLLPSGGRLVFDQTEALMAIDINSGKTQGKTNFESMVFRTNMEAAEAIARHLRLRDIGGQGVIDFIEMREKSHCMEVERTLRNAMRRDKACHDVGRMSSFGLLELVRQRTGTSAISISMEPCPHCHGTGLRRNMEWQALHTLRDIEIRLAKIKDGAKSKKNERRNADGTIFFYECGAELALYLLNRKRDRIEALEEKFGMHIEVQVK